MSKPKCMLCGTGPAKRYCPALDKTLCPVCCAKGRLKSIACKEDCRYLEGVEYQESRDKERTIRGLMEKVPHGEHDDIFQDPEAAMIAYGFESFFAGCYRQRLFNISDPKVKLALRELYFLKYTDAGQGLAGDEFFGLLVQVYDHMVEEEGRHKPLVGTILLRLLISIDAMSGGVLGDHSYLNYLKNNLTPEMADSPNFIVEDKFGRKIVRPKNNP